MAQSRGDSLLRGCARAIVDRSDGRRAGGEIQCRGCRHAGLSPRGRGILPGGGRLCGGSFPANLAVATRAVLGRGAPGIG